MVLSAAVVLLVLFAREAVHAAGRRAEEEECERGSCGWFRTRGGRVATTMLRRQ
jgi:hypothetical protein